MWLGFCRIARLAEGSPSKAAPGLTAIGSAAGRYAEDRNQQDMRTLIGIHPVREALLAGRPLERLLVAKGAGGARIQELIDLCRKNRVPVAFVPKEALEREAAGGVHQGVVAVGAAGGYSSIDDVAGSELFVVLDGVEDPHNLGAIIRTAQAAGAGAVIIPERRAVGLTETVAKAAAGAMEHVPVVRVGNVSQTLEKLKKDGYWIYGLDERGAERHDEVEYAAKSVMVLGGEGHGLHQHVREHCDVVVRIEMAGAIASLNVSVAAGVVLFEWRRRRRAAQRVEAGGGGGGGGAAGV